MPVRFSLCEKLTVLQRSKEQTYKNQLRNITVYSLNFQQIIKSYVLPFSATEIRCQEKSKGGLCYEVILAQPQVNIAPKVQGGPVIKSVSAEDIERKLRDAELRRIVSLLLCSWIHISSLMYCMVRSDLFIIFSILNLELRGEENGWLVGENVSHWRGVAPKRWDQQWI